MIFPDGVLWKEQRRFVGRSLKMLGGDLGEGMEVRAFSFPFIYFCFGRRGFSFPFIFVFGEDGFLLFLFYFFLR